MSLATVDQFKAYARKADEAEGAALYQVFLDAAEAIVVDYLGYSPAAAAYAHTFFGDGKPYLSLRAPIISLDSLTVDGTARAVVDFVIDGAMITDKTGARFTAGAVIVAGYHGGFATVPGLVVLTVLRIAALLSVEAGENIGVTSQSFDGGNSRSFLNYTNFDKYLKPLAGLRVIRLERKAP
jgi:hypothetical protein